jgi:hypothetical protein
MEFKYRAFISYNSGDRVWASWLQKKLENYKLPRAVKRDRDKMHSDIGPVFVDYADLNTGDLNENLSKELRTAEYLIVVCSPNAAQSKWVNHEVKTFIALGREKFIIPFIVADTPESPVPGINCYPDALNRNILGADVIQSGKVKAFIKVASVLLGLSFDELWQRQRRYDRLRWKRKTAIIAVLFIALSCVGYKYYNYHRIIIKYYNDYVDQWGIPQGIYELSRDQARKQFSHYEFKYTEGKLRSVNFVNSAGINVTEDRLGWDMYLPKGHYLNQNLFYDDQSGHLIQTDYLNENNQLRFSYKYSGENFEEIDIKNSKGKDEVLSNQFLASDDIDRRPTKTTINHISLKRDKNGFMIAMKYGGLQNIPDNDNIYGKHYKLDSLGRPMEIIFLGVGGRETRDRYGISKILSQFDQGGNLKRISYYDSSNSLTNGVLGFARINCRVDTAGNLAQLSFSGADGKLCYNNNGLSSIRFHYSSKGYLIGEEYRDLQGHPCFSRYGYAITKMKRDESGNESEHSVYDNKNLPINGLSGAFMYKVDHDEKNRPVKLAYFSKNGKPCVNLEGYSVVALKYDEHNRIIEGTYYDVNGKRCLSNEDCSMISCTWDDNGNIISRAYYDSYDKPCLNRGMFFKFINEYDTRGNLISTRYFNADGKPSPTVKGISKEVFEYNSVGNLIKSSSWDVEGKPFDGESDVSATTFDYDDFGRNIRKKYWDKSGHFHIASNYAIWEATFSQRGLLTEERFCDTNGKPVNKFDGVSRIRYKYDELGNEIEREHFDSKGVPCPDGNGVTIVSSQVRNRLKIGESLMDAKRHLVFSTEGIARQIIHYDAKRNQTGFEYFGKDGRPVKMRYGYASIKNRYDDHGRVIETSYYGVDGRPCSSAEGYAACHTAYDEIGLTKKLTYYDSLGRPCVAKFLGFARKVFKYDEKWRPAEVYFYGKDFKLHIAPIGAAVIKITYDANDNEIEEAFFDTQLRPCQNALGCTFFSFKHNYKAKRIVISCLDEHKILSNSNFLSSQHSIPFKTNNAIFPMIYEALLNRLY